MKRLVPTRYTKHCTNRERDVAELVVAGFGPTEIGADLGVSNTCRIVES